MAKKTVAIEVGKQMTLTAGNPVLGVRLSRLPGDDGKPGSAGYVSNTACYLANADERRVTVTRISSLRLGRDVWIEVESVRDATLKGWAQLRLKVPQGHQVTIGRLDFKAPVKPAAAVG